MAPYPDPDAAVHTSPFSIILFRPPMSSKLPTQAGSRILRCLHDSPILSRRGLRANKGPALARSSRLNVAVRASLLTCLRLWSAAEVVRHAAVGLDRGVGACRRRLCDA